MVCKPCRYRPAFAAPSIREGASVEASRVDGDRGPPARQTKSRAKTRAKTRAIGREVKGVTILVVEDDPDISSLLRRGLAACGDEVVSVDLGAKALDMVQSVDPVAIVLDVGLPDMSGLVVCEAARRADYRGPIIFLSASTSVADRVAGLNAGGDDYLVKPFAMDELIARIEVRLRIADAGAAPRSTRLRFETVSLDPATRIVSTPNGTVVLTERETALLSALMTAKEAVISRQSLYEAVWTQNESASLNVVDVYMGYLRHKLALLGYGHQSLIATIRGRGFQLRSPHRRPETMAPGTTLAS
ncbi:response regulator transcription factor [Prosthecomicrobium hirschii]|uniref:response regulator transcription factor n=1 Tax=Prosthecodimorpha hirschii TaxID=665126 RepID=UPI00221FC47A|nr:response regulator transcription factor [Prosthecomicrobium hirschii]MCW1843055.1 response regulator transcription factor [Prosthecomicrobium hirschii]